MRTDLARSPVRLGLLGLVAGLLAARRRSRVLALAAGGLAAAAGLAAEPGAARTSQLGARRPADTGNGAEHRTGTPGGGPAGTEPPDKEFAGTHDPGRITGWVGPRGRLASPDQPLEVEPPPSRLRDPETDLFSDLMFPVAVETRVTAARRQLQPVAVVLARVRTDDPRAAGMVATTMRQVLRESDLACRLDDGRFGLVLANTPENGAVWTVERLRQAVAEVGDHTDLRFTVHAGIACYPAHGFEATELIDLAEHAFAEADNWAGDRIEVAEPLP